RCQQRASTKKCWKPLSSTRSSKERCRRNPKGCPPDACPVHAGRSQLALLVPHVTFAGSACLINRRTIDDGPLRDAGKMEAREYTLPVQERVLIMGVLQVPPAPFSDGGR